jgi:hypothetical protein
MVVMTVLLWVVQVFLAVNFLFAGSFKLFGTDQVDFIQSLDKKRKAE